ncbi:PREDICTED: uncharacterized protein LOC106793589 [Polistes canadensis]|uniref:uncharacterized protein LOC106793589 n=1 Tax=Polistes canadensis TaxID=91411 RepID=UPI000718C2E6|nr:PREDICTED: uncharacterized protein LOC106793589 [Polistes canadensis]
MSSLIVAHDQRIMMLEFAVENLHVPRNSIFDKAILKKVTVMFRFLDEDWTELLPNRRDYRSYRGSNYENEQFYGGRSVVFALPESSLEKPMNAIDVQVYVFKEICDYFELDSCENVGFTLLRVDHLINAIIKELQERKELGPYLCNFHENDPISRSLIGTYTLMNDDLKETNATIKIYIRITYLGNCIITEFENSRGIKTAFHCRKDNVEGYPYQLRELTSENLQTGCWGSQSYLPPAILKKLKCYCKQDKIKKQILAQLTEASKIARETEAAKIAYETEAAKIASESEAAKISREAEASPRSIAKFKGLEKEKSKKKKKKKKKIGADAHILANIDNLYNEKIRFAMQTMKKQKAHGLGGARVAFSRRYEKKICSPLLAISPIQICSSFVGPCFPCPNFLPCVGSQPLPFATYCL